MESFIIAILSTYLAATNNLALLIEGLVLPEEENQTVELAGSDTYTIFPEWFVSATNLSDLAEDNDNQVASVVDAVDLEPIVWTDAVVNIYCQYFTPGQVRSMTGTGFFVSSDGAILTNAHIAQFLLLEYLDKGKARCFVGTGDVSEATYEVSLLYISPTWILANSELIATTAPSGNGASDFAILYAVSGIGEAELPDQFPYLAVDTNLLKRDVTADTVHIAGYPASTGSADDLSGAIKNTATTTIAKLYTLGTNYADILALLGSPLGERGVSGGPVVNEAGQAIGIISTLGDDIVQGEGSLNAISISYINRAITKETGYNLITNINGDLDARAQIFETTLVPWLARELGEALE